MKKILFKFERNVVILIIIFLIASCSTTNIDTSYYLLNTSLNTSLNKGLKTDSTKSVNQQSELKKTVLLELEELPEYLSQRYLVMQLDDHRLHYAQFHIWAEPLFEGIEKALLKDLNSTSSEFVFITDSQTADKALHSKLHIQVEHFFANNQSTVTLSGKYWFDDKTTNGVRKFSLTKELLQNGYPHSVSKMRSLLTELTEEILLQ